jgi:mono/diheme cytochrome c family protein
MNTRRLRAWTPRLLAAAVLLAAAAGLTALVREATQVRGAEADPADARQVALGERVYREHCAACHGADLEGQPDWQTRKADGRLPAPPHDETGHTWHHADAVLFRITKEGVAAIVPGYESDMPAYADVLTDEQIWSVLAYIKSRWPRDIVDIRSEMIRD